MYSSNLPKALNKKCFFPYLIDLDEDNHPKDVLHSQQHFEDNRVPNSQLNPKF